MMEWKNVELKDITNNLDNRRIPLNSTQRAEKESQPLYPYIGANNIMGYIDEYIFDEKIICIAEDGGSWGSNETCAQIYNQKVWVNNHAHVLTATEGLVLEYLKYYLNHADLSLFINGATRGKLTQSALNAIKIPLPPLPIQKKIAAILDEADKLRRLDKQLIEKYDALSQALFLDMFGDTWLNPKGWPFKLVEEVALKEKHSIKAGPFGSSLKKEFYVEKGYKIYGQEQVIKDDLTYGDYYIDETKYKSLESCKIKEGDILVSLVGTYGKISVVPKIFEPGIINPRLMKISPDKNLVRPDFLKKLLQNSGAEIQMKNQSRGGTMDIVNVGIVRKIKIPIPPITLQNQFAERIQAIEAQKAQAQAGLKKSEELFNGLLQGAFKGHFDSTQ
jgi:type I restriction enzyme, S subunit